LVDILKINRENNIENVINNLKPPIFWKDKQNIIDQVKIWNIKKVQIILKKLYELEITVKSNGNISKDLLLKKLLIDVCNTANS
jgi:DNA polymerase III delta subunit